MENRLFEFLDYSHSQFHSVDKIRRILLAEGCIELAEGKDFSLEKGKNYFLIRNLTSIIAFKIPQEIDDYHFQMVATHSDSPCFKVKENVSFNENGYAKLIVEPYGGMIVSTWLDKPLSLAGRLVIKKDNSLSSRLIDIDKDLCIIPNVAIHLKRDINDGMKYNPEIDLCPIIGQGKDEDVLKSLLSTFVKDDEEVIGYDLFLYNRQKASYIGANEEFISSPRLDDLASAYGCLEGFLRAKEGKFISVFACFDNEEVGSQSINGADSSFLEDTLRRISSSLGFSDNEYLKAIAKSFMISADNGHATHPNHPELSENKSPVLLGEGIVIKHNASMRYTTDALSGGIIRYLCDKENIPVQDYFNRSDIRGGSTLGNISISHVSVLSVDIGLAQLAMHSNFETMGSKDINYLIDLIKAYMSNNIKYLDGNICFEKGE